MLKVIFLLTLVLTLNLSASIYSQDTKFDLTVNDQTVRDVLKIIESKSQFTFFYNDDFIDMNNKISLNMNNQSIDDLLSALLINTGVTYKIMEDNFVVITPVDRVKQARVTGTITDSQTGETLPGVYIILEGTNIGTITDADGKYSLEGPPPNSVLVFSYMGYITEKVTYTGQSTIDMKLVPDITNLEEVVVIGYGTMKKSDLTGSVASVSTEDLAKRNTPTLEEGLQGMAAGVQVMKNSGSPGGEVSVRIRGVATINNSADPLYVVDGVMVGTSVSFLNPNDVESIEILKDASATAIYGSRGANGVIMITTKRGKKGQVKLNASGTFRVQTPSGRIDVANASTFATAANQAAINDNTPLNPVWTDPNGLNSIDWQDEMSRTSLEQLYNISATGGSENIQSMVSVGYMNNDGIILASNYKRLTARANVSYDVKEFLRTGLNVSYMRSETYGGGNMMQYATTIPTMDTLDVSGNLVNVPVQYPDGAWGHFPREGNGYNGKGADNQVAVAKTRDALNFDNRLLANANIDVDILKGLTFKTVLSANVGSRGRHEYAMKHKRSYLGNPTDDFSMEQSTNVEYIMEDYFTYDRTWGKHHPTFLAGYSVTKGTSESITGNSSDFPTNNIRQIGMTMDPSTINATGGLGRDSRQQSFFGRITYAFDDRYLMTASIRRDGSSNFGAGNRYGTFPSFSAAWRISQERFMKSQKLFSNLKLRAGWGQTGNAGNSTNLSVDQLSSARIAYYHYNGSGFAIAPGLAQINEIDTNLKWETNEQLNLGVDFGFMKNMLTVTVDYFRRDAVDLLLYKELRPSTGYRNIYTNAGHIRNSGLELFVSYQKAWKDWNLGVKANGTVVQNEAVDVGDDIYYENNVATGAWWGSYSVTRDGYPVGSYFGWRTDGLWQTQAEIDDANASATAAGRSSGTYQNAGTKPGDRKFKDIDGNGWVDDQDREVIGDGYPDLTYGLNINLGWKNLDFTMYLYGVTGQDILSYAYRNLYTIMDPNGSGLQNISTDYADGAWNGEGSTNEYPRLTKADPAHNAQVSDAFIRKGDFLKIQNLQLGYTLPGKLLGPAKLESARVFFSIENLLTITQYKVGDPEVGNRDPRQTGFDAGRYPFPRTFTFGISIGL